MERMRITVEHVRRAFQGDVFLADVCAVSRERVHGAPRAVIRMTIRLEPPESAADRRTLRRLARDEALRFLDVS